MDSRLTGSKKYSCSLDKRMIEGTDNRSDRDCKECRSKKYFVEIVGNCREAEIK